MSDLRFYGLSFIGKRSSNQDAFLSLQISSNTFFFAVADGMGGMNGGEIASSIAIEKSESFLKNVFQHQVSPDQLKNILNDMYAACNNAIANRLILEPALAGMGTTFTCLLIHDKSYVWANIGDSRLYVFRNNQASQITRDHTYLQEYVEKFGPSVPEQISRHQNIITHALDGKGDKPDLYPLNSNYAALGTEQAFILCSDGLILNKIEDQNSKVFTDYLLGTNDLRHACQQLVSFAYFEGSTDNITVVSISTSLLKRNSQSVKLLPYPPTQHSPSTQIFQSPGHRKTIKQTGHRTKFNKSQKKSSVSLIKIGIISVITLLFLSGSGYLVINNWEKINSVFKNNPSSDIKTQNDSTNNSYGGFRESYGKQYDINRNDPINLDTKVKKLTVLLTYQGKNYPFEITGENSTFSINDIITKHELEIPKYSVIILIIKPSNNEKYKKSEQCFKLLN